MHFRRNNHVFFFLHSNSDIAMGIVQNLQVMLFVFNLALSTVAQKAVTSSLLSMTMLSITKFLMVTCFKTWQSPTPSSVTWSAKMTVCVYPWIISLCPKKITVSLTLLIKTWSRGQWNWGKEEIIMIWREAIRWRWDNIVHLIPYSFIYELS